MDNRELYDGLKSFEVQTQLMLNRFSELREGVIQVLEKNSELQIENQHLRSLLGKKHRKVNQKSGGHEFQMPKSRQNLIKLYNEGFHVCNQFFGKHRNRHENCLFCSEILFRNYK